ncbi:MAG TPA: adenylosuccinate lyase family protein [Streptosporangiaceae bacterium]
MSEPAGLFTGLFARGGVDAGDAAWLQAMLDTEAALARSLERAGLAAAGAGAAVTAAARAQNFDAAELGRLAMRTGNPVPGLVRELTAIVPPSAAAAVHHGATSQDIIDTAMMLLARAGTDVIRSALSAAADRAAELAAEHEATPMIGRTLLQQAIPVTFGLVAAGWLAGLDEAARALAAVRPRLAVQFGGAAGTLASLGPAGPAVAALLAGELGLAEPVLPWHTSRLRIIELAAALAAAAAAPGKIARDVTLLAQTEIGEVREGDPEGGPEGAPEGDPEGGPRRGGSSAMPHKRNPVAAVTVLGCTRQIPGLVATLIASAEQEHQRAAGAWHAEWQPLTALLTLTGSAAAWCADLLAGLEIDTAKMRANLDAAGGLPFAEQVAAMLAPRLGRLAAHDLVAEATARVAATGRPLRDVLLDTDTDTAAGVSARGIDPAELDAALDPARYLGAASAFVSRALAAHRQSPEQGPRPGPRPSRGSAG